MSMRYCTNCCQTVVRHQDSRYCQQCWDNLSETRPPKRKCFTCKIRPATGNPDLTECVQCWKRRQAEAEAEQERLSAWHTTAEQFVLYRGNILALYPVHKDGESRARVEPVYRSISAIPLEKLLDLNVYQPGFTREQVKIWKKLFRQFFSPPVVRRTSEDTERRS